MEKRQKRRRIDKKLRVSHGAWDVMPTQSHSQFVATQIHPIPLDSLPGWRVEEELDAEVESWLYVASEHGPTRLRYQP